jgi:hypothetical protein
MLMNRGGTQTPTGYGDLSSMYGGAIEPEGWRFGP